MTFEMTDQVLHRLTDDTLVWLTTVTPSGRPAPRLVWFMWLDGASDPSQDAARLASDAPSAAEVPGLLAKYAEMLAAIGMTAEHFTGTYTVAMRVIPDHAWTVSA